MDRSVENGKPLPPRAYLCRQYLWESRIDAQRRTSDLSAYKPLPKADILARVADSAVLLDAPIYGCLWFTSDDAYQFIRQHRKGLTLPADKFDVFVREVCAVEGIELMNRMAANLEVEALAGRAGERMNRIAASVQAAIDGVMTPFRDIHYVRGLAKISVEMIAQNVERGYRSQDEADRDASGPALREPATPASRDRSSDPTNAY
jgi:hypothetical protein